MQGVIKLCHTKILQLTERPTANIPYPSKQHKAVVVEFDALVMRDASP